jgi:tetratricopeptide (TPR) repeat protein
LHLVPKEIQKPKSEAEFESMCKRIYGFVFGDPLPKINGRKGQKQSGIDVFIEDRSGSGGRIGIQCKKYYATALAWKHVLEEVAKADQKSVPIKHLIVATTTASDSAMVRKAQDLTDLRRAVGKFEVSIEFWNDIEDHIASHPVLQDHYDPTSPGAAFHRQEQKMELLLSMAMESRDTVPSPSSLPAAREDSIDKIVSGQLDATNDLIRAGRYRDALEHVERIGKDLAPFDLHQKARWHLQRGLCLWFSKDDVSEAAALFLKAAEIYPDDEKMAAAGIRGLMLRQEVGRAIESGKDAAERFPQSLHVWLAGANARMISGERIRPEDVPPSFRDEPDALQFCAISAREAGDIAEALRLAGMATRMPAAGFFNRAAYLRFAIENCTSEPVLAMHGLLPKERTDALADAVRQFEPRGERMLRIQSDAAAEAAGHLGFALLILGNPAEALYAIIEAEAAGLRSPGTLRVRVQALDDLGRKEEALAAARASLTELPPEALGGAAEIAASLADPGFIDEAIRAARERFPENLELADYLTGLRWGAMAKQDRREEAATEALAGARAMPDRIVIQCSAARILKWAHMPIEAEDILEQAAWLADAAASPADRLLVADLLHHFGRWSDAAAAYEFLLGASPPGPSGICARLLECHIESGKRAKARHLIARLPDGWAENDEMRQLAIRLGQRACDWDFLLPLARKQIEKAPAEAWSWLFLLNVMLKAVEPAELQRKALDIPDDVDGSIRNLAILANMEMRYGDPDRGLLRLYRLARRNLDEPEALSAYLMSILTAKNLHFDASPECVAAGTFIEFEDVQSGARETLAIDPPEAGHLPSRDGFMTQREPEAVVFIGAKPGDEISLPMKAGGYRPVRILGIGPAFRRLSDYIQEQASRLGGLPHLRSVRIGSSGDPQRDLAHMHEMLKRSRDATERILDSYASGGLTLSLLAKALGRSTAEMCAGWPSSGPKLFVGSGLASERLEVMTILARADIVAVADSSAIAELALFDAANAIACLPRIMISPATREAIDNMLVDAEADDSVGTAFDDDGRLGYIEYDDRHRRKRINFAKVLADIADRCETAPSYGDLGDSEDARSLERILSNEDRETLLLAKEKGAILLTLDGRLRLLAKSILGMDGAWPQALVMRARESGAISAREASSFTAREFLANRSFVSLRAEDIIWIVSQGDAWLQTGLALFKNYLSSEDTDRDSSFEVALAFLGGIATMRTQVGAFAEIVGHLSEAFHRRANCLPGLARELLDRLAEIIVDAAPQEHILSIVNVARNEQIRGRMSLVARAIADGIERAKLPDAKRPIRVRVLHCSDVPWLMLDRSIESEELSPPVYESSAVSVGDSTNSSGQYSSAAYSSNSPASELPLTAELTDTQPVSDR